MEGSFELIWFVIGLPLAGFLVQALIGKRIITALGDRYGKKVMGAIAVLPIAASFGIALSLTSQLAQMPAGNRQVIETLYSWISLRSLNIPFEAMIDPLSMTMVLIITGVGALIHLYATGYMGEEKDYTRFFTYLNLFIAFMLVLVLGNNLALMFIGWEGVGLCSYLLIGFWYKDIANAKAANKAFIVNRIGDWGLSLGLFMLVALIVANLDKISVRDGRWLSYDVLYQSGLIEIFRSNPTITFWIAILLFVGACGKSAQFPLYFWLPDAMAGPTPVSALIHAATMVTAGVFMVNRLQIFFALSEPASAIVAGVGAFTALFAAIVAFGQTDIKKVLAYSTVSQLGFMFIGCGAGAYWAGMFHVTTHAFFKALLFLGSGAVIYAMAHEQDMRKYGNLWKYLPITSWTMIIGWLAIAGVPGFSGFFSKEALLGGALGNHLAANSVGVIAGWIGLFVAMLTAGYMTRMTLLTFGVPFSNKNEERWRTIEAHHEHHAHDHEAAHEHAHSAHDDPHGYFYTDSEMEMRELMEYEEEHHHLDSKHNPREVPISMWLPLAVLAVLSAIGGIVLLYVFDFKKWLYPNGVVGIDAALVPDHPHGFVGSALLWMSILAAAAGIVYGFYAYGKGLPANEDEDESKWAKWRIRARDQFGYDHAMVATGVQGGGIVGNVLWKVFDSGIIDGIVNGVAYTARGFGDLLRKVQTGYVRSYALLMMLGGLLLIAWIAKSLIDMGVGI